MGNSQGGGDGAAGHRSRSVESGLDELHERYRTLSTGSAMAFRENSQRLLRDLAAEAPQDGGEAEEEEEEEGADGDKVGATPPARHVSADAGSRPLAFTRGRSQSCNSISATTVEKQRRLFDSAVRAQHRAAEEKAAESDQLLGGLGHVPGALSDPSLREFAAKYESLEPLGSGTYSFVRKVRRRTDNTFWALKVVAKAGMSPGLLHQTRLEVKFMRMLRHRFILHLEEAVETPDYILMVLELVQGSLLDAVAQANSHHHYSEFVAARHISQLLEALSACHALNIVHMDLKPDNVLLGEDGTVKLADFGLAAFAPVERDFGVPMFVSPETLVHGVCGPPADLWAVGVLTYVLLCGFAPFIGPREGPNSLDSQIIAVSYEFFEPYWSGVSEQAKDFVSRLLLRDPAARPTADEAGSLPWLTTASATALPAELRMRLGEFNAKEEFHSRLIRLRLALRFQKLCAAKVQEHQEAVEKELKAVF